MTDTRARKAGKIVVWALLAALIVGLAGFGVQNFSGSVSGMAIGSVAGRDITAQSYFRTLSQVNESQRQQGGKPLTLEEAEQMGVPGAVRRDLAARGAAEAELTRLGLSLGDDEVARRLRDEPAFQTADGRFDRDTYEYVLDRNGWQPAEYQEQLRNDAMREVVQRALVDQLVPPVALIDLILSYVGEERALSWLRVSPDALDGEAPAPTEADLAAFHAERPDLFTLPETRDITWVWLRPEDLAPRMAVDPDTLRALYDERIDEFRQPERRLVERLVFADEAAASAALDRIASGAASFGDLVAERGLSLSDVDLGLVTEAALGEAGAAVFALREPGVAGPLPSPIGPALFRMNGIVAPQEVTFEEAAPELGAELALEAARRDIAELAVDYEDRLAAGATLEDLATETALVLGRTDWTPATETPLAGYPAFRETAAGVTVDDYPMIRTLEDGGIFALRLNAVIAPRLQTLDEARDAVRAAWTAEQTAQRLAALGAEVASRLAADTLTAEEAAAVQTGSLLRSSAPFDLPADFAARAFALAPGETAVISGPEAAWVLRLDSVTPPDASDPQFAALRQQLAGQLAQAFAGDVLELYDSALLNAAPVQFDAAMITAVHNEVFR